MVDLNIYGMLGTSLTSPSNLLSHAFSAGREPVGVFCLFLQVSQEQLGSADPGWCRIGSSGERSQSANTTVRDGAFIKKKKKS